MSRTWLCTTAVTFHQHPHLAVSPLVGAIGAAQTGYVHPAGCICNWIVFTLERPINWLTYCLWADINIADASRNACPQIFATALSQYFNHCEYQLVICFAYSTFWKRICVFSSIVRVWVLFSRKINCRCRNNIKPGVLGKKLLHLHLNSLAAWQFTLFSPVCTNKYKGSTLK